MNLSFPTVALLRSSGLAAEAIQQRWTLAALSAWWRTAPSSLAPFHRELATHGVADTSTGTSGLARFYKNVSVKETDSGAYQVYLDRRVLKTPARQPLTLPTEPLALAIAAEWEWQRQRIEPNTMPLMSLAATAIDQPQHRDIVIEAMVSYIAADPVICRLDASPLAEKQAAVLNPVLAWMENHVGVALEPSCSIFAEDPPEMALDGVRRFLQSFDDWELAAAEQLAATCKSVCLALKAVRGGMSIDDVLRAARVEEDHQIAEWGLVEGGHDLDLADMKVRVAAPCVFLGLIRGGDGV